jgi:hypothetical protein
MGIAEKDLNSGAFRSGSSNYDSLDVKPRIHLKRGQDSLPGTAWCASQ